MEKIEFDVRYRYGEYLSIVKAHSLEKITPPNAGKVTRAIYVALLIILATFLFFLKSWRIGRCRFVIDQEQISRQSNGGTVTLPWSQLINVNRFERGWLLDKGDGAMPIPFRVLTVEQREFLTNLIDRKFPLNAN